MVFKGSSTRRQEEEMAHLDQGKKKIVADIIRQLHDGLPVEQARDRILGSVGRLTSAEITDIEQSLVDEGLPPEEIRRFCNVHALLFESAMENTVGSPDSPSHPVSLLKKENREIEKVAISVKEASSRGDAAETTRLVRRLAGVTRHYELKENALFPALEAHGFTGPSKVMWAKHDEVRGLLKKAAAGELDAVAKLVEEVNGMVFKEENILFPAALERLEAKEWVQIRNACEDIGFAFLPMESLHATIEKAEATTTAAPAPAVVAVGNGQVTLPTGTLSLEQLTALLDTLPVDISFVDADDTVRYFSQSKDRIFVRAVTVIGRKVQNCHPPQSVHIVEKILEDFRSGRRSTAEFWITLQGKRVHIRYFAVRNAAGAYLGTLEVTQDITGIQALTGERRLLEDA
jgi:uncharacterized protein